MPPTAKGKKVNLNIHELDQRMEETAVADAERYVATPAQAEVKQMVEVGMAQGLAEWLDISQIEPNPYQPRGFLDDEELEELVASIDRLGQLQPVLVRPHPTRAGRFQMAAGHRRMAAVKAGANAGIKQPEPQQYIGKLLCVVAQMNDEFMADAAWDENEVRASINIFDRAGFYQKRKELGTGMTWEQVAQRYGISKNSVLRIVRVLQLPPEIQKALPRMNLAETGDRVQRPNEKHCRALLLLQPAGVPLKRINANQRTLMEAIKTQRLSGDRAIALAEQMAEQGSAKGKGKAPSGVAAPGAGGQEEGNGEVKAELGKVQGKLAKRLQGKGTKPQRDPERGVDKSLEIGLSFVGESLTLAKHERLTAAKRRKVQQDLERGRQLFDEIEATLRQHSGE